MIPQTAIAPVIMSAINSSGFFNTDFAPLGPYYDPISPPWKPLSLAEETNGHEPEHPCRWNGNGLTAISDEQASSRSKLRAALSYFSTYRPCLRHVRNCPSFRHFGRNGGGHDYTRNPTAFVIGRSPNLSGQLNCVEAVYTPQAARVAQYNVG